MSLKAYDGMLSRKPFLHIQKEIQRVMPDLQKASENKLADEYIDNIIEYTDFDYNPISAASFHHFDREYQIKKELEDVKREDTTLLSVIFQVSKILSKSLRVNPYTVHLNITFECINNRKTLIYPNILVNEHKDILLTIFDDWYAQNQCDPDENVSPQQWKHRCKDWYGFNETSGYISQVHLFSPIYGYGFDSINEQFRGEEMINAILFRVPSDESRVKRIAKRKLINTELEKQSEEAKANGKEFSGISAYLDIERQYRGEDGDQKIQDYIKDNPIEIVKIDEEYLKKKITLNKID